MLLRRSCFFTILFCPVLRTVLTTLNVIDVPFIFWTTISSSLASVVVAEEGTKSSSVTTRCVSKVVVDGPTGDNNSNDSRFNCATERKEEQHVTRITSTNPRVISSLSTLHCSGCAFVSNQVRINRMQQQQQRQHQPLQRRKCRNLDRDWLNRKMRLNNIPAENRYRFFTALAVSISSSSTSSSSSSASSKASDDGIIRTNIENHIFSTSPATIASVTTSATDSAERNMVDFINPLQQEKQQDQHQVSSQHQQLTSHYENNSPPSTANNQMKDLIEKSHSSATRIAVPASTTSSSSFAILSSLLGTNFERSVKQLIDTIYHLFSAFNTSDAITNYNIDDKDRTIMASSTTITSSSTADGMTLDYDDIVQKTLNAVLLFSCLAYAGYAMFDVSFGDASMTRGWTQSEIAMRIPVDTWSSYESNLQDHPVSTKTAINVIIYLLGDWLSQTAFRQRNLLDFDPIRTIKNGFIGLCFGPLVHEYYQFSDSILPVEGGMMNRIQKIIMDQTIYLTVKCSIYIMAIGLLNGNTIETCIQNVQTKIKGICFTAWKFWPLVHLITYNLIPARHRILWVNCVDLIWNAILATQTASVSSTTTTTTTTTVIPPASATTTTASSLTSLESNSVQAEKVDNAVDSEIILSSHEQHHLSISTSIPKIRVNLNDDVEGVYKTNPLSVSNSVSQSKVQIDGENNIGNNTIQVTTTIMSTTTTSNHVNQRSNFTVCDQPNVSIGVQ